MLRKISLIVMCLFAISACSSKNKTTDAEEVAPGITSEPIGGVIDSDSGQVDGLYSINFPYDKASLSAEAEDKLQKNAQWMRNNPDKTLQVEGHCDARGSIEYNLTLGERRARKVKNHLVGLGIDEKRLTVLSYGEEKPLDDSDSEQAYAKNRRANFVPLTE